MIKYFNYKNDKMLGCPCGCGLKVKSFLLSKLDKARYYAEIPFVINSGARCIDHNRNVGGIPNSSHIKGLAVDIHFKDILDMSKIIHGLSKAGFDRIGYNLISEFIHADLDLDKPSVIWEYK